MGSPHTGATASGRVSRGNRLHWGLPGSLPGCEQPEAVLDPEGQPVGCCPLPGRRYEGTAHAHHAWSLKPGQTGRCGRREPSTIPTWAVLAREQPLGPRPELPWASLGPLCSLQPCSWASLPTSRHCCGQRRARQGTSGWLEGRAGSSRPAIVDAGFPWPGRLRGARSCLAGP